MMETMHLIGAEDVRAAANTMRSSADEMQRAASQIDHSLAQHQRFLDDWLQRFQAVIESHNNAVIANRNNDVTTF